MPGARGFLLLWILVMVPPLAGPAAGEEPACRVRYLSADHVYLDAGSAIGLAVADTVRLQRGDQTVATAIVAYVATRSASCTLLEVSSPIEIGDVVFLVSSRSNSEVDSAADVAQPTTPALSADTGATTRTDPTGVRTDRSRAGRRQWRGRIDYLWHSVTDRQVSDLDADLHQLRFRLSGSDLFGRNITLQLHGSLRHHSRSRGYATGAEAETWRNRIHAGSLSSGATDSRFRVSFGRLSSQAVGALGYWDGLLAVTRLSPATEFGLLAGSQPDWQTGEVRLDHQRYGAFLRFSRDLAAGRQIQIAGAAVGEYHDSEIGREFLVLTTGYRSGRLNLYQSSELDLNRQWRRDRAGEDWTVANLTLSGSFRFDRELSVRIHHDTRRNHWTEEYRSLPDSLFDDAVRHGWRLSSRWRPTARWQINLHGGWRNRADLADKSYSYGGSATCLDCLVDGIIMTTTVSGFSGAYAEGLLPSLRLERSLRGGHQLHVASGMYNYRARLGGPRRTNNWVRLGARYLLTHQFELSGEFEYDWGDDTRGQQLLARLGHRF
ncbi:MAG: hypothetical protein ABIF77_05235 [bacterium]